MGSTEDSDRKRRNFNHSVSPAVMKQSLTPSSEKKKVLSTFIFLSFYVMFYNSQILRPCLFKSMGGYALILVPVWNLFLFSVWRMWWIFYFFIFEVLLWVKTQVDAQMLHYQNSKLSQLLEVQRNEINVLEGKLNQLHNKQVSFDENLSIVSRVWDQVRT